MPPKEVQQALARIKARIGPSLYSKEQEAALLNAVWTGVSRGEGDTQLLTRARGAIAQNRGTGTSGSTVPTNSRLGVAGPENNMPARPKGTGFQIVTLEDGKRIVVDEFGDMVDPRYFIDDEGGGGSGAAYAQIGESARQFDITRQDKAARDTVEDEQWGKSYNEGVRQFDAREKRESGESLRDFEQRRDQFAANFAESQHQFDYNQISQQYRDAQSFDLQRAGLAQSAERDIAGLRERGAERTRSILKEAPDFLARAYFSRGGVSPQAEVSQADLLNALNKEIAEAQANIRATVPTMRPAPELPTRQAPPTPMPTPQTNMPRFNTGVWQAGDLSGATAGQVPAGYIPDPAYPTPNTRLATGGHTNARFFLVGEEGPEIVENPEGEDLRVRNNMETQQMMAEGRGPQVGFALGTSYGATNTSTYGTQRNPDGSMTTLTEPPPPPPITQDSLNKLAVQNTPPGVSSVLQGQMPQPMRFKVQMPTAQLLGSLTDDELSALSTRLASGNESLSDLMFEINRRYAPRNTGAPRFLGSV